MILSPRSACMLAAFLAIVLLLSMTWASMHAEVPTVIDDCAMILTREHGPVCR